MGARYSRFRARSHASLDLVAREVATRSRGCHRGSRGGAPKLISTPQELAELVKRANALLALAIKAGARSHAAEAYHHPLEVQSRIWKLVTKQHELWWVHGAQLFGREVD